MKQDSILPLTLDGVCFDAGGERHIHDISHRFAHGPRTVILGPAKNDSRQDSFC